MLWYQINRIFYNIQHIFKEFSLKLTKLVKLVNYFRIALGIADFNISKSVICDWSISQTLKERASFCHHLLQIRSHDVERWKLTSRVNKYKRRVLVKNWRTALCCAVWTKIISLQKPFRSMTSRSLMTYFLDTRIFKIQVNFNQIKPSVGLLFSSWLALQHFGDPSHILATEDELRYTVKSPSITIVFHISI